MSMRRWCMPFALVLSWRIISWSCDIENDGVAPARQVLPGRRSRRSLRLNCGAGRGRRVLAGVSTSRGCRAPARSAGRADAPVARVVDRAPDLKRGRAGPPWWVVPPAWCSAPGGSFGADLHGVERSRAVYGPRAVGSGGAASEVAGTCTERTSASAMARTPQRGRGHQFSVRSIHGCIRARTATIASAAARRARSRVPAAGLQVCGPPVESVRGQRPARIPHNAASALRHLDCGRFANRGRQPLTAARCGFLTDKGPVCSNGNESLRSVPADRRVDRGARPDQAAYASTWTVDDDKADCPNAAFTLDPSGGQPGRRRGHRRHLRRHLRRAVRPGLGNNSPSQAGSRNGLTITKPLTIKGAGADKVTIRPAARARRFARRAPPRTCGTAAATSSPISRQSRRLVRRQRELPGSAPA